MCATTTVQIENYPGAHEVHIPWQAMKHVQEWLKEFSVQRYQRQEEDSFEDDSNEDEEMIEGNSDDDDSDSLSDFDFSSDESDPEEGGVGGGETSERNNGQYQHSSQPQDAKQRVRPANNNRIAYWIPPSSESLIMENKRGHVLTHVHRAIVLQKSDFNWVPTGEQVAIKSMSWEHVQASRGRMQEDFLKEIAALQYFSQFYNGNGEKAHVMTANTIMANNSKVFIVMPFCADGDIVQQVAHSTHRNPFGGICLSEAVAKFWFRQILTGLRQLQSARLCHRDLSPENFIILDQNTLVIDFGMCLRIPYSEDGSRHLISKQTPCGKLKHMSPEISLQQPFDGHAVDLYSTGTVLLFMLTGTRLEGPIQTDRVFENGIDLSKWGLSDDAIDLLRKMFRFRPIDRLTLDEICAHPFCQS